MEKILSKLDIAALRKADSLAIHLTPNQPEGLVRAIKRAEKTERDPFAQDIEHVLPANVTIYGHAANEAFKAGRVKCFELVHFYHNQRTHASNVIKTLRVGDEVTFRFYPDANSNGYIAKHGLHADALYMDVRRTNKAGRSERFEWKLATQVCEANSARMCNGAPVSESYHNAANAA